jgi:simple sugar transport system permease protein
MRLGGARSGSWSALGQGLRIYGIAILLAFTIISLIIALLGYSIPRALNTLVTTSFSSAFGFRETVKKMVPLLFTTYAFTIPFMIKFFNIGGWGQMLFGGTVASAAALSLAPLGLPAGLYVPLLLLIGTLSGGLLGLLAGWLKAAHDISPIISTIMLNFIAFNFVSFIATAPPYNDPAEGHPITLPFPETARIGSLGGFPLSIFGAAAAVIFVTMLLKRTRLGYEITAVGYNLTASGTYGIDFSRTILLTFFIGGALAGIGGTFEVLGIHGKLIEGFAKTSGAQYGIFGILTALVVGGSPAAVPVAAFLMSVLLVGADALQRTMQIPVEVVFLSQAIIVLTTVTMRHRIRGGR